MTREKLRRLLAGEVRRQTSVPEDQIDHVVDQIFDAAEKAKAKGIELDEIELPRPRIDGYPHSSDFCELTSARQNLT
jgi:hypothetical protein